MVAEHDTHFWLDGQEFSSRLSRARGLHYGDGAFRTILEINNKIIDMDRHVDKLIQDCSALDLTPDRGRLYQSLQLAARSQPSAVLKLIVMRCEDTRGYRSLTRTAQILAFCDPLPTHAHTSWTRGIRTFISTVQLAAQPLLAGIKHLNRLEQVLASRNWPADVHECILCDMEGRPVCGSRTNLFWMRDDHLYTPSLSRCGVAGMMRGKIIELARGMGMEVVIGEASKDMLLAAEEVFVCNSLVGIWPVRGLGQRAWRAPGRVTARLMELLAHPWDGRHG